MINSKFFNFNSFMNFNRADLVLQGIDLIQQPQIQIADVNTYTAWAQRGNEVSGSAACEEKWIREIGSVARFASAEAAEQSLRDYVNKCMGNSAGGYDRSAGYSSGGYGRSAGYSSGGYGSSAGGYPCVGKASTNYMITSDYTSTQRVKRKAIKADLCYGESIITLEDLREARKPKRFKARKVIPIFKGALYANGSRTEFFYHPSGWIIDQSVLTQASVAL
jgi:hypothetical protein